MIHTNKTKTIHWIDALRLLEISEKADIKVWKLSTGDIIEYRGVHCIGSDRKAGTHLIRTGSGRPREFRDITLFEINGMEIFR